MVINPYEHLRGIQEAIERIMKYTAQGRNSFDQEELVQNWVIHHLEIIGRAVHAIPQDFKELHPEISWREFDGMRNILVRYYVPVNRDEIWAVVEDDLPGLKTQVEAILCGHEGSSNEASN